MRFTMKGVQIKERIFEIIEKGKDGDIASKIFDDFIIGLICINVFSIFLETFSIEKEVSAVFKWIEIISVIIFTIEYLLRLWTAP